MKPPRGVAQPFPAIPPTTPPGSAPFRVVAAEYHGTADFVTQSFIENAGAAWGSQAVENRIMGHIWREIMQVVNHMGMREWFWVLAAMILLGVVCLRGYGSRSKY